MTDLPAITVSSLDRDRLYAMLERVGDETDQVAFLYAELERATVVAPAQLPDTVAGLGDRLTFRNEATGKESQRVLLLPRELDSHPDGISILTAAGAAMLGLEIGATIQWPHQGKQLTLKLLAVSRT